MIITILISYFLCSYANNWSASQITWMTLAVHYILTSWRVWTGCVIPGLMGQTSFWQMRWAWVKQSRPSRSCTPCTKRWALQLGGLAGWKTFPSADNKHMINCIYFAAYLLLWGVTFYSFVKNTFTYLSTRGKKSFQVLHIRTFVNCYFAWARCMILSHFLFVLFTGSLQRTIFSECPLIHNH